MTRTIVALVLASSAQPAPAFAADAHVVTASVLALAPTCSLRCTDSTSVRFLSIVRLDSCNVPSCSVTLSATVWPQIRRHGAWRNLTAGASDSARVFVGERARVAIRLRCRDIPGDSNLFRTMSRGGAIGGHSFYPNTPKPNVSKPVSARC